MKQRPLCLRLKRGSQNFGYSLLAKYPINKATDKTKLRLRWMDLRLLFEYISALFNLS